MTGPMPDDAFSSSQAEKDAYEATIQQLHQDVDDLNEELADVTPPEVLDHHDSNGDEKARWRPH